MDRSAIEALQELLALGPRVADTDYPVAVLPSSMSVTTLEKHQAHPFRMRAQILTKRIAEFTNYVIDAGNQDTVVFVQPDGRAAVAVMDFGNTDEPGWQEHSVILNLDLSPEMQALENLIAATPLTQRQLIEFIEDWHEIIGAEAAGGGEMTANKAIAAIRSVTIEGVRKATKEEADFEASVSALEKVSASSNNGALPGTLRVSCPYLRELTVQQFEVRLSILTTQDTPMFNARIVGLDRIQKEAADEVESLIRESLDDTRIYLGELRNSRF
mgnify:CR=1 FL=1